MAGAGGAGLRRAGTRAGSRAAPGTVLSAGCCVLRSAEKVPDAVVDCACCGGAGPTPEAGAAICSGFRTRHGGAGRAAPAPAQGRKKGGKKRAGQGGGGGLGAQAGGPMVPEVRVWHNRAAKERASRARPPARADRQDRGHHCAAQDPGGDISGGRGLVHCIAGGGCFAVFAGRGRQSGAPAAAPAQGYLSQKETDGFAVLKGCGTRCL